MKTTRQTRREATQLFRACFVDGLLDEKRARQVVEKVIAAKPRGFLEILTLFRRLVKLEVASRTAKIESAQALAADMQTEVQTGLARTYGRGLSISFSENAALLAGMRIRVGSDVYDGSVQGRLTAIEESF